MDSSEKFAEGQRRNHNDVFVSISKQTSIDTSPDSFANDEDKASIENSESDQHKVKLSQNAGDAFVICIPDDSDSSFEQNVQKQQGKDSYSVTPDQRALNLQPLRKPEYSQIQKGIWFIIVLTCTGVCVWQLTLRIQYFWQEPTVFQFTIERQSEINFPAVTICPAREPFQDEEWVQALEQPNFSKSSKATVSLKEVWSEFSVTADDTTILASCNESHYCDFMKSVKTSLTPKILPTFWGDCITLSRDTPMEYTGAATFLAIVLRHGRYAKEWFGRDIAAQYFFHEPQTSHRLEAFLLTEVWSSGRDTVVQLTLKEYNFLKTSRNPCDTEANVIACRERCIDEKFDQTVRCSLPFMKSKWPPCRNGAEAKEAYDQTRNLFYIFNSSDCVCRRQCREKIYSANTHTHDKLHDNTSILVLQFASNLIEKAHKEFSYTFSALVSDLGGSLRMFLGASILSLCKMIAEFSGWNKKE